MDTICIAAMVSVVLAVASFFAIANSWVWNGVTWIWVGWIWWCIIAVIILACMILLLTVVHLKFPTRRH